MDQIPLDDISITYFLDEMGQEEKVHYGDDFLMRGELALLQGDFPKGIHFFELATKCDPHNASSYFRQGISLFDFGSEEGRDKALFIARKKFEAAAACDPSLFENWQAWGNLLFILGSRASESRYFYQAEEKYKRALGVAEGQTTETLVELYWDHGAVWMQIAESSGEALDAQQAIDAFHRASSLQERLPALFWNDFGKAAFLLAEKITDLRLYVKAINCFKHAVSIDGNFYEGWVSLATALEALYDTTHDEDHFSQASECYATASQLQPNYASLWVDWAQMLASSGRRVSDSRRLRSAIEKCHRAHTCEPSNPLPLAIWAESLALLGELSDRLDLIYDAQSKIAEAEELSADDPEVCYSHALCLTSFGRYFQDLDYYYQAIEQLQQGLSTDRTRHHCWHAMAGLYATVGQIEEGLEGLERACRFYQKAIDLNPCSYYIVDQAIALSKLGELSGDQETLENALAQFERALQMQKNAIYLHPDWLFHYAVTLDMLGDFYEDESYYGKALEILSHVLMVDPDFPSIHHRLALVYAHKADLMGDTDTFHRALHHFRFASKREEENDQVILDWGVTLTNLSQQTRESAEAEQSLREAEGKLTLAAKLGHPTAYYQLSALYALSEEIEKSMSFLYKARQFGALPSIDDLLEDDWFENVRETAEFRAFIADLERRQTREP